MPVDVYVLFGKRMSSISDTCFSAKSGVTDYYAVDDEHALYLARQSIKNLNRVKDPQVSITAPREPLYDPEELYGIVGDNLKKVSIRTRSKIQRTDGWC